jgi:hypothetical protein
MAHLCECGCGAETPLASKTNRALGHVKGQSMRFLRGHNRRAADWSLRGRDPLANATGLCLCGCGQATAIATKTDRSKGWIKGQPLAYARGHNATITNRPRRVAVSEDDWTVEDRGYETPCWIWKGKSRASGRSDHRKVGIDGHYESAHAAVYRRLVGPVPRGHELHHLCEQQACVRPVHLRPLTKSAHSSLHARKLSDDQVRAIRVDRRPLREIAAEYGINWRYASSVRSGWVRRDVAA